MGIFGKKSSRKNLMDIIQYEGPNDVFIWKHTDENFNTRSQLIVLEGQEAIFLKNGQAMQAFGPGHYTLSTENCPWILSLIGLSTGGETPFQCSVYFVNKAISMGIEWGTDSPIRMNDPIYHLPVNVTAYGDFSLQVEEPKKLLLQLVGTTSSYTQDEISRYFNGIMATKIRSQLTSTMIQNNLSLLGIDAHLEELSNLIIPKLDVEFQRYGLKVNHFAVAGIGYTGLEELEETLNKQTVKDIAFAHETERTRRTTDIEVEATLKKGSAENRLDLEKGHVIAEVNKAQGRTQLQKEMIETAKIQAANTGHIIGKGSSVGFGPAMPFMGLYGTEMKTASTAATESLKVISELTKKTEGFEPQSSSDDSNIDSFKKKIEKLKLLRENGMLSDSEFEENRKRLLDEIVNGGEK